MYACAYGCPSCTEVYGCVITVLMQACVDVCAESVMFVCVCERERVSVCVCVCVCVYVCVLKSLCASLFVCLHVELACCSKCLCCASAVRAFMCLCFLERERDCVREHEL